MQKIDVQKKIELRELLERDIAVLLSEFEDKTGLQCDTIKTEFPGNEFFNNCPVKRVSVKVVLPPGNIFRSVWK